MPFALGERFRAAFAPPRYLAPPLSGIDISTSGVKVVRLEKGLNGIVLADYAQARLPLGIFTDGEIIDRDAIVGAIASTAKKAGISSANVSLPESKAYLFETAVPGADKPQWRTLIEQHLDEIVPLPPAETAFDIIGLGRTATGEESVIGVGFARRMIDDTLSVFDEAGIPVRALEEETFAMARALLPAGDTSTTLIIDVGKTTSKMAIVTGRIPRFATTFGIGGHALTLAVQKHFGVTEAEARKVKADRGIVSAPGNEEYLAAMLSTVSAIRDEISRRLEYWQEKETQGGAHEKVSHIILSGGNASIRGFPEYLEGALGLPVTTGDVFANFASRDTWIPALDYRESLAYATAIGLALRDVALPV
ncbi:MAG: type IV pilus assembly protein PilM [Patescibacteria group bacterium]|nr:type IV pilus assembly protein PilM [Patescibacteria group bacterium]